MLIWLREHDYIDAALVSGVEDDDAWKAKPAVVQTKEEILATAGSRYTYCANPLALPEAKAAGHERLALVGMGCQTSSPPTMWDRKAGKVSKPFQFNIGLLCSKTFDDAIFTELFEAKYGLKKQDMVKMNIKGVFQIWMKDGSYHEIDLKECHAWTREGCKSCPDFSAEHSDIATGGIGGVHRGAETSFDISADLQELAQTPVTVVCAGAQAILDLSKTLAVPETLGVPVIAYRQDDLPAFWSRQSGLRAPLRLNDPKTIANAHLLRGQLGLPGGQLIANPIPQEAQIARSELQPFIARAQQDAHQPGIVGKRVTPYLLQRLFELTEGRSLQANIALIENNARLAAEIARELVKQQK